MPELKELTSQSVQQIVVLTKELNPNVAIEILKQRHFEMFEFDNYYCFGLFENEELIGVASGWITVRLYSGKQLEIDNVIVNPKRQCEGLGEIFLKKLEHWAKENTFETVELNAYVQNRRAHKFYFKHNYKVLGFHFQKVI